MRILFVCFSYSVHAARWLGLLAGQGWDVHVVPSQDFDSLHAQFTDITYWPGRPETFVAPPGVRVPDHAASLRTRAPGDPSLASYVRHIVEQGNYDVIHSLEFQHAGYLVLDALEGLVGENPRWIATNYGADICFFRNQPFHRKRILGVLRRCDAYGAECQRDVALVREMGFTGELFEICPNSGGIDLAVAERLRSPEPPSRRRVVAVKGYEHFAGRALTVLAALRPLAAELQGYQVAVYAAGVPVRHAVDAFRIETGIDIVYPLEVEPHETILALHGRSRISIGNSTADGISTSLLEAMAMGSFPIQSWTACADEWLVHGRSGLLTDPDDPDTIRDAVRRALQDDALVDAAAIANAQTIAERADSARIAERAVQAYRRVLATPPRGPSRKPMLTVITPTFNRAGFLEETISSVLSQSFRQFEYLIIDDGSQDDTESMVRRFSDPRIRYLKQANVGETRTVNRALQLVAGEFFTIVNSDDPAKPGAFAAMMDALESVPDALMAYPDWEIIDDRSRVLDEVRLIEFSPEHLLMRGNAGLGPGAMFRRSVIELVGLRNPLIRYAADLDYIFRLSLRGRMVHVPRLLATHRIHAASASIAEQSERLSLETLDLLRVYGRHPLQAAGLRQRHRESFAVGCFAAGLVAPQPEMAVRLLARGFLAHPIALLRRVQEHGPSLTLDRLLEMGCQSQDLAAHWLDQALAKPSRQSAVALVMRAFLTDPVGALQWAMRVGFKQLDQTIRSLPMATHATPPAPRGIARLVA